VQSLPPSNVSATEAAGGADALMKLGEGDFRTLFLDSAIEDLDVEELMETIRSRHPELKVVLMGPENETDPLLLRAADSVATVTSSAGIEPSDRVERAAAPPRAYLPETASSDAVSSEKAVEELPGIIGTSSNMRHVYRLARLVAPRSTGVLIVGATGTGKELVARGLHELSPRRTGPFIAVNCAAIPESLLEAELFGFTRGAFTGAFQSRLGRIHAAQGGTLLLDEVGELPLSMQAKLLRFIQEGEVQRLGSADLFRVDARVIAATNVDLPERIRAKQFREDLYYRLAVFPIELPPLCERLEDILPLAHHFLKTLASEEGMPPKTFSAEAAALLQEHSWPGNVRELQHWVGRAFVMAGTNEQIRAADLSMFKETRPV